MKNRGKRRDYHDFHEFPESGERIVFPARKSIEAPSEAVWGSVWATVCLLLGILVTSCSEDDSFTVSPSHLLTFSTDTVSLDTVFSTVPTATRSFWVYNRSGDGIRCTSVRLERGNQTGFRVNVDGAYLGSTSGFQVPDIEVRNKDSIRVFVELTSTVNNAAQPQKVDDNLVFMLESGIQQKVNLNAYSWDATILRNPVISQDTTIAQQKPLIVYGGITVQEGATLTIGPGTTIYFHGDAGLHVHGTLLTQGTPENNVVLRGDRIDRMFAYLPYDRVSGQWQGLHFYEKSYDNQILYTDIHSAYNGIVCDSADVSKEKLLLQNSTVHNCQGHGLIAYNSLTRIYNSQITNTLGDCLSIQGGLCDVNNTTLAQYYPFDANRGVALRFSSLKHPLLMFNCQNTLVTGYSDDEVMGEAPDDGTATFVYQFDHCIMRTPEVDDDMKAAFTDVIFENPEDTITGGKKHFRQIDTDNLRYDFRLSTVSPAVNAANTATSLPVDRNGRTRDPQPDIGCYEYEEVKSE